MKNILQFLFDFSDQFEVECNTNSLNEAISKIEKIISKKNTFLTSLSLTTNSSIIGQVKNNKVVLYKTLPLIGNIYKPYFFGHFISKNNRIILTGKFTMRKLTKVLIYLILLFSLFVELIIIKFLLKNENLASAIFGILILPITETFIFLVLNLYKKIAKKTILEITQKIKFVYSSSLAEIPQTTNNTKFIIKNKKLKIFIGIILLTGTFMLQKPTHPSDLLWFNEAFYIFEIILRLLLFVMGVYFIYNYFENELN